MTETLAYDYAQDIRERIALDVEAGTPFGIDPDLCDGQELNAFDYLEDVLDIEYRIGSDRKYRSSRLLIGWGGPNVWIDTQTETLSVYWGSDSATVDLPEEFINALDEALEELWEMGN